MVSHVFTTLIRSRRILKHHPLPLGLHRVPQPLVVEQRIDGANGRDGNVAVPKLAVGKVHNILLGDRINHALDLTRLLSAPSGDKLAANVLRDGGGSVKREKDGGLELGLGALDLGGADVGAETHPLADGKVDKVIDAVDLVGNKEDTPKAVIVN